VVLFRKKLNKFAGIKLISTKKSSVKKLNTRKSRIKYKEEKEEKEN